ncbi:MAG: helix-turn-helix domain-containing protein [Clostridia bacterium]|nr:helix-turn-helix domain-containing protein [Clostridia bacterium]
MEEKDLKEIIAQNIFYLRTINHMTQYELGEQLNYSDKAISKWERADGIPDAYVLKNIAQLFGVTVDYLLTEHSEQDKKIEKKPINTRGRALVLNVAMLSVVTIAVFLFVIIALATEKYIWQIFIYALPVIAIVGIVFSGIWRRTFGLFLFISLLVWSIILTIYFAMGSYVTWLIFLLGIPAQVIVFLSFGIKINIKMNQKNNPILITAMEKIQKKSKKK